jgi:hypothetical protein
MIVLSQELCQASSVRLSRSSRVGEKGFTWQIQSSKYKSYSLPSASLLWGGSILAYKGAIGASVRSVLLSNGPGIPRFGSE